MNDIVEKQNRQESLDLLLAQRKLYTYAKTYFTYRSVFATILAFLGPILAAQSPTTAGYVGLLALAYLVIDHLFLQSSEERRKNLGAKVQELFDTKVLTLQWNTTVAGEKPAPEEISEGLGGHKPEEYSSLRDWYAIEVASVDIGLGRVLCQRSNLVWDSSLRRRYVAVVIFALFILISVFVAIAYYSGFTFGQVIGGIVFPCLPLLELLVKQIRDHLSTAKDTEELIRRIDPVIDQICSGNVPHDLESTSRTFQDEIYRHRKSCPLVFDWLYWRLRNKNESNMQFSVRAKVTECGNDRS